MSNTIKIIVSAVLAAVGAYFQMLMIPFIVAVSVMLVDWLSGLAAAGVEGVISSRIGIIGIIKKVGYAFVIVVGMVVDWIIHYAARHVGIETGNFYYFGLLVIVWIIINELISILENVVRMGVPVPKFLEKAVHSLKIKTEEQGEGVSAPFSPRGEGDGSGGLFDAKETPQSPEKGVQGDTPLCPLPARGCDIPKRQSRQGLSDENPPSQAGRGCPDAAVNVTAAERRGAGSDEESEDEDGSNS